jgi:hypothetical protein
MTDCPVPAYEEKARLRRENEALKRRVAELERERNVLLAFAQDISKQKPEKPDHWSSCGQCEHNIEQAQDIIESSIPAQAGSKKGE